MLADDIEWVRCCRISQKLQRTYLGARGSSENESREKVV